VGLGGDLPEAGTLGFEESGVLHRLGGVSNRATDVPVLGLGDRAGVGISFGTEGALHLGEQSQEEEGDATHALVGRVDRQRVR
jgi:hypothetical protein